MTKARVGVGVRTSGGRPSTINIYQDGAFKGSQPEINFIGSFNINNDITNRRVNVVALSGEFITSSHNNLSSTVNDVVEFANDNSITIPNDYDLSIINYLVKKVDLSTVETFNVYGFGSIEFGTLNLKDATTFRHTSPDIDSIAFSRDGVKSDLTANSFFNTNYKVNQRSGIESSFSVAFYVSESSSSVDARAVFGSRVSLSSVQKIVRPIASAGFGKYLGYTTDRNFANTEHKGLYILTQSGTKLTLYKDWDGVTGVKSEFTTTPVAPTISNDELFLAYNSSSNGGLTAASLYDKSVQALIRFNVPLSETQAIQLKLDFDTFLFMK